MLLKEYMIKTSNEDGRMDSPGMCSAIFEMKFRAYSYKNLSLYNISSEERGILKKCIDDNVPFKKRFESFVTGSNNGYHFKRYQSAPRIKWVEKRLKELKKLNK